VPAVAVRQGRQVLFIFNRYIGYLDGVQRLILVPATLEFDMWEEYVGIIGGKIEFANTNRTDNGEGKPLCTCICCTLISIENSIVTL
jgi:hypothetical protein